MDVTWSLGITALQGAAAWSDVYLPEELWRVYARLAANAACPSEIYIAIAIVDDVPGAVAAFERVYFPTIGRTLFQLGATLDELEATTELVRHRLFVARRGRSPLVLEHAGQGTLTCVIRSLAVQAFAQVRDDELAHAA